jgi:hypothetical protein
MDAMIDDKRLKELFKAAIVEVFEERPDLFREVIEEALEDAALARAIEEGEGTELIGREEVFHLLEGQA